MQVKSFLAAVILVWCGSAAAQQRPHYTQYVLNNFIINPAVAGIENYIDVKISHRHQWVGIQDAPVTTYLTVHGSIGKDDDGKTNPTSYLPNGENPRGKQYWQDYTSAKPHHGWGATLINDRTGPLNRFSAYGTYAYHMGIGPQTSISGGISVGLTSNSLNTNKLIFDNPIDPAVQGSGTLNRLRPDINAGLFVYSADFFGGISAQQIINQGLEFRNTTLTTNSKSYPHFFATAGYRLYAGPDWNIIPSVVVRYVNPLPVGVDICAKAQYLDRFWLGAAYRVQDGVSAMAGLNISNKFNLGYAYDYTTSPLQNFTKGTHEIVLGFLIGNRYGDLCPRNIW